MESVKLTVQVVDAELTKLENRVNALKNTPISLKINASGLDKATKDTTALISACARLVEAQVQVTKAENAVEKQRLTTEATANRARQAEANYAKQVASTATEQARLATQQEKTATASKNLEIQQEKTNTAVAKGDAAANRANVSFSTLLGTYLKFAAISAVKSGISDAFETMKDVDTQIINIQKVTNATDAAMDTLSERAYSTASKYGVAANEYLAAAADFAKAGYSNYEELAELATKTQLVGDVTADVAAKFLLSADAAYKYGGDVDALSTVLDKANTIENNYATSIEKMAAGFPNVASTASMAKVSIDELLAALGTVTAVTQESGEKASYALRSLFLNILGDVGAEIDETTKVTADSVNTLWGVISKYADESLIAAHNAGELIDPMEAIKALSQAQKDNLLEEADLMQMVMALGGKLRTNQLQALISNYDMYEEMLAQVQTATGSADKEVETMSKSWEASLNRLKNAWTQLVSHVVSSDTLVNGIKLLENLVKLLDNDFVALIAKAVLLTSVFKPLSSGIAKLIVGFKDTLNAVKNLPRYLQLLGASEKELEAVGLSAAEAQTALSIAIGGLFAAGIVVFQIFSDLKQEAREEAESLRDSADATREAAEESMAATTKLAELYGAYEQSSAKGTVATTAAKNLAAALKEVGVNADLAKGSLEDYAEEALLSSAQSALSAAQTAKDKAIAGLEAQTKWNLISDTQVDAVALGNLGVVRPVAKMQSSRTIDDKYLGNVGGSINLDAAESYQDVLDYYNWLLDFKNQIEELAHTDPSIYNDSAVKQLYESIDVLDDYVQAFTNADDAEQSAQGLLDALNLTTRGAIESKEAFDEQIAAIQESSEHTDAYKENFVSTMNEMFPLYAAQAEAAQESADGIDSANESSKRFVDTLFDEKGALKDSAAATLEANGALQQLAASQAKEDLDAANEALNTLIDSLGGEDSAVVVKALELISMGSEAAEAELAKMGDAGKDVRDTMELLAPALDKINAAQEKNNIITKATAATTAATTAAGNALIAQAEAALRGEAGAAEALGTALRNADSATIEYARATVQAQAASAQANFNNLVSQLGGVTSAAVQATLAMYAAYTAFSGGGRPQGATSGAGFSKEQAELLSNYDKMQEALKILDMLDSSTYGGGGSTGGGGGGGSSTDPTLKALQDRVSLRKQELALMQERGDPVDEQIAKQREIQEALAAQADYMRSIGSDQTDILKLSTEWWNIQNAINKLLETSQDGVNDSKEEQLKLEERILAVQEAQAALANAQNERNIRVYNSKTGQWEWIANASDVSKAQDSLKDAQDKLSEYDGDTSGYEDVISKLLTYDPSAQTLSSAFSAEGVVRAAGAGNAMTNATTTNSIGQQMNGNIYQIAGMSFTEEQARGMTLYDLAQMSNNLTIYSHGV